MSDKILFVGDIMPGGCFHYSDDVISDSLLAYLHSHSLRVGTLEAAIGDRFGFDKPKVEGRNNIIYAKNTDLDLLVRIGVDVVSLANNHVHDLGADGLANTINMCRQRGIKTCGAGSNIEQASQPAVTSVQGKTVAFLAYCCTNNVSMGYVKFATENEEGVAPLVIENVIEDIQQCKQRYDYVVVLPHWGEEDEYLPIEEDVETARLMIDAGADAVMGSHTHSIAPMIAYKGKPIYFSMGNFMFPDYYMYPPRPMFYPLASQRNFIKRKFGYPFPIDEPQMQIWEGKARVGMIVSLDVANGRSSYKLTSLSQNNVVDFFTRWSKPLKCLRLKMMGKCVNSLHYGLVLRFYYSRYNWVRRAWHWAVKVLRINFDEKIKL